MVKITFEESAPPLRQNAPDGSAFMLTEAAWTRLAEILAKHPAGTFLRIQVKGGGCNGYSYFFKLDQEPRADDHVLRAPTGTAAVHLDAASLNLLHGSTLTYSDTLEAAQFVVENPNATSSCGCGNSFGV